MIFFYRSNSPSFGTEGVLSCAFSPDGSMAVTGTQTGSVYVCVHKRTCTCTYNMCIHGHTWTSTCCVYSHQGSIQECLPGRCVWERMCPLWFTYRTMPFPLFFHISHTRHFGQAGATPLMAFMFCIPKNVSDTAAGECHSIRNTWHMTGRGVYANDIISIYSNVL